MDHAEGVGSRTGVVSSAGLALNFLLLKISLFAALQRNCQLTQTPPTEPSLRSNQQIAAMNKAKSDDAPPSIEYNEYKGHDEHRETVAGEAVLSRPERVFSAAEEKALYRKVRPAPLLR